MEKTNADILKVAVVGAESTGKTTLSRELAEHYNDIWMPEYARTYVKNLTRPYNRNDVIHIASAQCRLEKDYEKKSARLLFLDTDLVITKVWLQHVWKNCPAWIDRQIANSERLIYLLCDNDLPWTYDPVRENPDIRKYLSGLYKDIIIQNNFPYFVVKGHGKTRTMNAVKKINTLL